MSVGSVALPTATTTPSATQTTVTDTSGTPSQGGMSFDESLGRLTAAFDEAIAKGIKLETLKIQKGQEFKAANTSIDQK